MVKFNKRILVAPLDWGLGHATRCIPVIRLLIQFGCDVYIATSGQQEILLKNEFPDIKFLHLPGYQVQYGKRGVMLRLLRQIPVIRRHIFTENAWLQQVMHTYRFDGVISDNRYGLYHTKIPSVLITHQLNLQLPRWATFMHSTVQKILFEHIEHFSECWVPDIPEFETSLSGALGHPKKVPQIALKYIGWLSRFTHNQTFPKREDAILISLSGPEPQRTLLEEKILEQVPTVETPIWLVRGLPGENSTPLVPENVTVYNHLNATAFQELMMRCKLLISRSGYSTLMDAMVLGCPIACVPTPGQTEQEYLSQWLNEQGWAISQTQETFSLSAIIGHSLKKSDGNKPPVKNKLLFLVIENWLNRMS